MIDDTAWTIVVDGGEPAPLTYLDIGRNAVPPAWAEPGHGEPWPAEAFIVFETRRKLSLGGAEAVEVEVLREGELCFQGRCLVMKSSSGNNGTRAELNVLPQ